MKHHHLQYFCVGIIGVLLIACGKDTAPSVQTQKVIVHAGYSELPNGHGGYSYESVAITEDMNFDKSLSLKAFSETLYPHLKTLNCNSCHSTETHNVSGAQSPIISDTNVELAHEYALTTINFKQLDQSKIIEQLSIYRHHCNSICTDDAAEMLSVITEWKDQIESTLQKTPRLLEQSILISDREMQNWINKDKENFDEQDLAYIVYTSMHELHNKGLSADELNIVRVGLSKALNSVSRWSPKIVNPVDINDKGILYRFDIRDYWGWNKGVTQLLFGGSDDNINYGQDKTSYLGQSITPDAMNATYNYAKSVEKSPLLAKIIWQRILHGNVEGAKHQGNLEPNIDGFKGDKAINNAGEYIPFDELRWVEATQLIYTLTRPDVYNSIMMIPMSTNQLEKELGVNKDKGMDSYKYSLTFDAMTVDSQLSWRADREDGGFLRKTFNVATGGLSTGEGDIFAAYASSGKDIHFPFWANPIPLFIALDDYWPNDASLESWSFIATLARIISLTSTATPAGCDPVIPFGMPVYKDCRHFTGTDGLQQSSSHIIWNLPNGLQGYMLAGEYNQRRLTEYIHIARDPRRLKGADDAIASHTKTQFNIDGRPASTNSPQLLVASSCIGCHIDGVKRNNNDLRDWLDNDQEKLPKGEYGVDSWLSNLDTIKRVKQLYPASKQTRDTKEAERKIFLEAMVKIKNEMIVGQNKNMYVEPVIWAVEYAQNEMYKYPQTTAN